jgi:hypothetical protein
LPSAVRPLQRESRRERERVARFDLADGKRVEARAGDERCQRARGARSRDELDESGVQKRFGS